MTLNLRISSNNTQLLRIQRQSTTSLDATTISAPNKAGVVYSNISQYSDISSDLTAYGQYLSDAKNASTVLNSAQSGLVDVANKLEELKTYAITAKHHTLNSDQRGDLQTSYSQALSELQNVSESVKFDTTKLLDRNFTDQIFQIGDTNNDVFSISFGSLTLGDLGIGETSVNSTTTALDAIDKIDEAINLVTQEIGNFSEQSTSLRNQLRHNGYSNVDLSGNQTLERSISVGIKGSQPFQSNQFNSAKAISFLYRGDDFKTGTLSIFI